MDEPQASFDYTFLIMMWMWDRGAHRPQEPVAEQPDDSSSSSHEGGAEDVGEPGSPPASVDMGPRFRTPAPPAKAPTVAPPPPRLKDVWATDYTRGVLTQEVPAVCA